MSRLIIFGYEFDIKFQHPLGERLKFTSNFLWQFFFLHIIFNIRSLLYQDGDSVENFHKIQKVSMSFAQIEEDCLA